MIELVSCNYSFTIMIPCDKINGDFTIIINSIFFFLKTIIINSIKHVKYENEFESLILD